MGNVKKVETRFVAKTMLEVLIETGKINMTEVSKRVKPNIAEESHNANGYQLVNEEVMKEFYRLIRCDDKAVERLNAGDVIKSVLADLLKLDHRMEDPDISAEDLAKLASVKTQKQKMLGSYFGIFRDEKSTKEAESDPDKLFQGFKSE